MYLLSEVTLNLYHPLPNFSILALEKSDPTVPTKPSCKSKLTYWLVVFIDAICKYLNSFAFAKILYEASTVPLKVFLI